MCKRIFFVTGFHTSLATYPVGTEYFTYEATLSLRAVYEQLVVRLHALPATTVLVAHSLGCNLVLRALREHKTTLPCVFFMPYVPTKPWPAWFGLVRLMTRYIPVPKCCIPRCLLSSSASVWSSFSDWKEWQPIYVHQVADAVVSAPDDLHAHSVRYVLGAQDYVAALPTAVQLQLIRRTHSVTILPCYHEGWADSKLAKEVLREQWVAAVGSD
jgi:hypothetical protein